MFIVWRWLMSEIKNISAADFVRQDFSGVTLLSFRIFCTINPL